MPGMYELHEQIMCRRREAGTQSWNWRTGSIAPVISGPTSQCSASPWQLGGWQKVTDKKPSIAGRLGVLSSSGG